MIPFSPIRACAGRWPVPAARDPDAFTPTGVLAGFPKLPVYPAGSTGPSVVLANATATAGPLYTPHWLKRNGALPLTGTVDGDGVIGYSIPSPKGWGRAGGLVRIPRSLVVTDEDLYFANNATATLRRAALVAALTAAGGPLADLGVDVYVVRGPARFLNGVPQSSYSYDYPYSYGGRQLTTGTPVAAADLTGGDVYVVSIGPTPCGWNTREGGEIGYFDLYTQQGGAVAVGNFPPATGGVLYRYTEFPTGDEHSLAMWVYYFPAVVDAERASLLALAARCRNYRFDVAAPTNFFPFRIQSTAGQIDPPSFTEADTLFRGAVPGTTFGFTYTDAGTTSLAADIISRALAFFA